MSFQIIKSILMVDILKDRTVTSAKDIGTTISSGIEGVNKSQKVTTSDGKSWLLKLKSGEHKSKWRLIPGALYRREKAAYLVDRQTGFNVVPETIIVTYKGEIGSAQEWIEDTFPSDVTLKTYSEDDIWKVGLLDFLIGNTDRHSGNWLMKNNAVVAIDHGYAFPNEKDDPKSIILSRFTKAIEGQEIPEKYLLSMENLRDRNFKEKMARLLDKESFVLFKLRLRTLISTQIAKLDDYKVVDKLKKVPGE
jgi:hypothetical protein